VIWLSLFKILTYRTFEPTEISGLQVWLDNETLGADGSAISTWSDSSGNANDFTQSDATLQPVVFLDGSRKTMRINNNSFLAGLSALDVLKNTSGGTIYTVYKPDDNSNPVVSISDGLNSFNTARLGQSNNTNYIASMNRIDGGSSQVANSSRTVSTSEYIIHGVSGDFSNSDLYQYLNGTTDGTNTTTGGSNSSNTNSAGVFIGATLQVPHGALVPSGSLYPQTPVLASIKYAEVLMFNRVLTALEKYNIENYLSIKHGIPLE
jgi:hypothetical protein